MFKLAQYGRMSEGYPLLQPGSASRMLNEGQALRWILELGKVNLRVWHSAFGGMEQRGVVVERYVAEHLVRKSIVDHNDFSAQVCRYSCQPGAVLRRLDLEVGISQKCGDGSQHRGAEEGGHCRNALRHDDDHAIATGHTVLAKYSGLKACALAKLR